MLANINGVPETYNNVTDRSSTRKDILTVENEIVKMVIIDHTTYAYLLKVKREKKRI